MALKLKIRDLSTARQRRAPIRVLGRPPRARPPETFERLIAAAEALEKGLRALGNSAVLVTREAVTATRVRTEKDKEEEEKELSPLGN